MPGATTLDRIIVAAVALLIAAFTLGALGPLVTPAAGDDVAGKRGGDGAEIEAVEEEDDDFDPFARGDTNSGDGNSGRDNSASNSGSRSIGSNSGNTATGTTKNTGVSRSVSDSGDASKNTKTGTTRGTGPSHTVSNSS